MRCCGSCAPRLRRYAAAAATRDEIASLRGIIKADREIGLFVSSGGFTRDARREANHGATHIELVDLDRFLELWLQNYGKNPEAKRTKLRLEPVYFLAPGVS